MQKEKFKLPRSSYEELCKIIKAYGSVKGPVALEDVSKLTVMHPTAVSRNHGFLAAIKVIEGGQRKVPTDTGKQLGRALNLGISEEVGTAWREIVQEDDFLSSIVAAVRIRNGMDISSLQRHIIYSAGVAKAGGYMAGSAAVIEILKVSGMVSEKEGAISPAEPSLEVTPSVVSPPQRPGPAEIAVTAKAMPSAVSMHIEVRIHAKPSELEELGKRLKTLLDDLSKPTANQSDS